MSEYAELKARLAATPLCEASGEETNLGEQAAAAIDALERQWDEHDAAWCERVRLLTEQLEAAEARAKRLEDALQNILDTYEATSELHTSAADCAANLYHRARAALQEDKSHE